MRLLMLWGALVLSSVSLGAQPPAPTEELNRMKALDYMVGEWKGTGWIEQGRPRETFAGTELIQKKLNGLALLVEGKFTGRPPGQDHDVVVHETLAVISYDRRGSKYNFRTYLANGMTGDHDFAVLEKGWQWGLQFPGGRMRYTMTLQGADRWVEVGELSQDGTTWRKFFEMTLQRAPK